MTMLQLILLDSNITLDELNDFEKQLLDKAICVRNCLIENRIDFKMDAQFITFNTLAAIIRSVEFYFILRGKCLLNDTFWKEIKNLNKFPITNENFNSDIFEIRKDIDRFMSDGFLINSFSFVEIRFRIFHSQIFDGNKKGEVKTGDISPIFKDLEKNFEFPDKKNNAFKLFRMIRNTFHNNGLFTKPNKKSKINRTEDNGCKCNEKGIRTTYDSISYYLEYNKCPDFGNIIKLLIKILHDIKDMLCEIIESLPYNYEISDPYFNTNKAISYNN
jgi:hypothetical protein